MSKSITEHELTFALNCLGVDSAMNTPDFELAGKLFEIVQMSNDEPETLEVGEEASTATFALGDCSSAACQPNPIDDAVRLSHAAANVADALAKLDSHVFSKPHEALTNLVASLSTHASAKLGEIDVNGPVQINVLGTVDMSIAGDVKINEA